MADFPTAAELWAIARNEALANNNKLTLDAIERHGTDLNALVAAGVGVCDALVGQLVDVHASLFLGSSQKNRLDHLVHDRYQELRKPASPAVGEAEITLASPATTGFTIPVGTTLRTSDGRSAVVTTEQIFPVGSSGPITVLYQTSLAGLSQQIASGAITTLELPSAPQGLTITNALASAGADDAESDTEFKGRARAFYKTRQRGTAAAIERAALSVPGIRTATAYESITGEAAPARIVSLVISDAFTEQLVNYSVVPGSYETQSAQMTLKVQSALQEWRACGIQVLITMAVVRVMGITLLLRFRAGVNVAATAEAARAVAVGYTNGLSAGDTFVPSDLESMLQGVPGLEVLGGEVASPATPQTLSPLQVWRTTTNRVTVGEL